MDKIFIQGLKVSGIIGILPHEKTTPQPLILDLEIFTDIRTAAISDDIKDTVDYTAVVETITHYINNNQFQLLETLAEKISELLFAKFNIASLHLQITKPKAIANAEQVGISIARSRD